MKPKTKTSLLVGVIAVGVMTLFLVLTSPNPSETSSVLTSNHRSILLHYNRKTISNNTQISGTFHGKQHVALFYAINGVGSMGVVSGGGIGINDNGSFSRAVSLPKDLKIGSALELRLYTQNANGQLVDELTKQVIYQ